MKEEKMMEESWIQTYTGKKFYPLDPREEDICIEDIAHALSMQCRYSGHILKFYSVAEHSVYVSYLCNFEDNLHGLLHDASEAYLVDIPRPLKRSGKFEEYKIAEKKLQKMIYKKFLGNEDEPESIHKADMIMLATEATQLFKNLHPEWKQPAKPSPFLVKCLNPQKAEQLFLNRFYELYGK